MKYIKSLMEKVHKGEGGFTLIELLIVVAILGVIAAVVALNIGGFFGTGTEQAANTEAHQVQTAIIGYMAGQDVSSFDAAGTINNSLTCGNATEEEGIVCYLMNPAMLQASYDYGTDGALDPNGATPNNPGKWSTCQFINGMWDCTA